MEILGLNGMVDMACCTDRAGKRVLEYLLYLDDHDCTVHGLRNIRELFALGSWYLWWERRKFVHGEKTQTAEQIAMSIQVLTANFTVAVLPKARVKKGGWSCPPHGFVKLNVDAAFDQDSLLGAAGAIVRDSKGAFIRSGNCKIDLCIDALSAEALAVRFGLELARSLGCKRLIINSDNFEVIEVMNNGVKSSGVAVAVFDDSFRIACDFSQAIF